MRYRLGVDVGGTFTDILLMGEGGETWRGKVPSTPNDQSVGILKGITSVCGKANAPLDEISAVIHGTTVATNVILERRGARVGLVTTEGFGHILQIARSYVPGGLAGWIVWPKPEPLADLTDTVEAVERVSAEGDIIRPLDEADMVPKLRQLGLNGIEVLCVCLINSFNNGSHEQAIRRLASEVLPGIPVSLSSEVLPEIREYERTITTVVNGYVQPQVSKYVSSLVRRLREDGISSELSILRSDAGLATAEVAGENPVSLLLSGPVGGVAGAVSMAEQLGISDFLTLDMGGTSTDVALVEGLAPRIGRETTIGDLTVRATSVDVRTVGAGGGSIAHVPELTGALRVGPHSAGAEPGPASYGKGGLDATVTDANVVLGYLPTELAGGEISLDLGAARDAWQSIANATGLESLEVAAAGAIDVINENILGALRLVSVQQGFDPRDFALMAFGGAGPLHANALGKLTGAWPVVIPPSPGVLCAYGDVTTSAREESARTFIRNVNGLDENELRTALEELRQVSQDVLKRQSIPLADQSATYVVDLRYEGQGSEIPIEFDVDLLDGSGQGLDRLRKDFDAEHERVFSFRLPNDQEIVNLRATVSGPRPNAVPSKLPSGQADPSQSVISTSEVWMEGEMVGASVFDRATLMAGNVISGPAIIVEMDSTTLVLKEHAATVDPSGSLLIRPIEGQADGTHN